MWKFDLLLFKAHRSKSSAGKMELFHRKFWRTNCKPFKIVQEKWDYILNLHTYILPILHSLWSWIMRKSKSRAGGMVFTARKMYPLGSQTKRHRKPTFCVGSQSYGIIWRAFVCCWHICPGYKIIRYCFLKNHAFVLTFLKHPFLNVWSGCL